MVHDVRYIAEAIVWTAEAVVASAWKQQRDRLRMAVGCVDVAKAIDGLSERIDLALRVQFDSRTIGAKAKRVAG